MGNVANLSVFTPGGQPGALNPSEGLAVLRQNQTAFMETIGVMPPESLAIAAGSISPTTAVCIVDTEGSAPADNLTTINATLSDGTTLHDGMVILLSAKDASRVVTVKNSDAPNGVKTVDGKDIALSTEWSLVLQYVGGVWQQINVAAPLKPATETTLGPVKVGDGLTIGEDGTLIADLATADSAGRVKASETAQAGAVPVGGADGDLDLSWSLGKIWIGVPRYWRSTTLPPNHCWANGDFVEFADWPQLEQVYNAGGFAGMLMAWDADSGTQAANLGQWRPDAAEPTGLYTPNLTGQFLRCWTAGEEKTAGAWGRDEIRNISGSAGDYIWGAEKFTGALSRSLSQGASISGGGYSYPRNNIIFNASDSVPTGPENVPPHVWQPIIIYLGKSA